jgi:hypothetical protein
MPPSPGKTVQQDHADLAKELHALASEELLQRYWSDKLAQLAQALVADELHRCGITVPMH